MEGGRDNCHVIHLLRFYCSGTLDSRNLREKQRSCVC